MVQLYSAIYRDKNGEEITTMHNDGKLLNMVVRGVTFSGDDFDFLQPTLALDNPELSSFTLCAGYLCNCEIECDMPMPVVRGDRTIPGNLHVHLKLGAPRPNGTVDNETLQLHLDFEGQSYLSCGRHGYFEDELLEIQRLVPESIYLKCCFNCAYSDYSPAGSGLFGDMLCFRDNKQVYLQIQSKTDLFHIWDTMSGLVQETYLCPEFERRIPGTGYRG
jgi:hypothetical protein